MTSEIKRGDVEAFHCGKKNNGFIFPNFQSANSKFPNTKTVFRAEYIVLSPVDMSDASRNTQMVFIPSWRG